MSEEKKTPAKKQEPGKGAKILNWFKTLPQRIAKPFRNMYYELKKVTWPTKQRLISYSIIVLVFMLFMSVVIGLLDMGASAGVRSLIAATSNSASASTQSSSTESTEEAAEQAAETAAETAGEAAQEAAATAENTAEEAAATVENAAETAEKTAEEAAAAAGDGSEGK